jgi:hypothetical protein
MPRARRARDRRSRARKGKRTKPFPLILEIEVPLTDAINYVRALEMVGKGMILDHDDAAETIMAVAGMASERLEAVKATWNKVLDEKRRQRS